MVDCRKCQQFDGCYYDYDENCVGFLPSSPQKLQREKQKAHANEILENYWKRKNSKQTNADRIRAMTDEELAEFLDDVRDDWGCSHYPHGTEDWLDWLKQESKT
jgi:hypothetical protein